MIVVLGEVSGNQHMDPCCFSLPLTVSLSGFCRLEAQKSTRSARLFSEAGLQSQWCAGVSAPVPPCFPLRWEGRIALLSQSRQSKVSDIDWTIFFLGPVWPRGSLCQPSVWDGCSQEQSSEGGWRLCPKELWWTGRSHQVTTDFLFNTFIRFNVAHCFVFFVFSGLAQFSLRTTNCIYLLILSV